MTRRGGELVAAAGWMLIGCAEATHAARAEDAVAVEDGELDESDIDVDEVVTEALRYEETLVRFSSEAETSETHADAASVFVWGTASAQELYRSIDPDDSAQSVGFAAGTMFVKEHFDVEGDKVGLTVMYKGPAGYNPLGGDWVWARVRGRETTHAGRVDWCANCHNAAINTDFVVGFRKGP